MWPWGHLAVGYLCFVLYTQYSDRSAQTTFTVAAVAIGSQFPDVVDKPLAWTFAVLPSGRSFAHSLLTAGIIILVVYRMSRRWHREDTAVAFAIGYVTHSLADLGPDVVWGLLRGDVSQLEWTTYLFWPLLEVPPYQTDSSFIAHFAAFAVDPYVLFQFGLAGVALAVWVGSGTPGLRAVSRLVGRSDPS
jgi:hypothetical protein